MLHIVNKSPLERNSLDTCLRTTQAGDLLLIEDAVYAVTQGNVYEDKIREAMGKLKIHALAPDLEARGMKDRVIEGVTLVDFGGFVDLVAGNSNCQSWL